MAPKGSAPVPREGQQVAAGSGAVFIFAAASVLVWMQIDNRAREDSATLVKGPPQPFRWLLIKETLSSGRQSVDIRRSVHCLHCGTVYAPSRLLSNLEAADAFYHKMIMFSTLPPVRSVSVVFWFFCQCQYAVCACGEVLQKKMQRTRCCRRPRPVEKERVDNVLPKDKMVCCMVVLLIVLYPTMITQVFSMLQQTSRESRYLKSDLRDVLRGPALLVGAAAVRAQLLLYVFAIPLIGVYFLRRNKDFFGKQVIVFSCGLPFNGYSENVPEAHVYSQGVSVALGIFGSDWGGETEHAGCRSRRISVFHGAASPGPADGPGGILASASSLVIIWGALWSSLLFYHGDVDLLARDSVGTIVLVPLTTGIALLMPNWRGKPVWWTGSNMMLAEGV